MMHKPTLRQRLQAFRDPFSGMSAAAYDGAYGGANDSRFRIHHAYGRSREGDEDALVGPRDRGALRLECRDLWRNNEICRGAVDRFVEYAIWHGIYPQFQTTDEKWNNAADAWWREIYVPTADFRHLQGVNLITLQRMMVSHRVLDGECGFILLANGQLQAIEAERICTPSALSTDALVTEGVRRTKGGIVTGYYVCDRKKGGSVDKNKSKFVRRENFVHCFKPGRIDQIRGVPDLAPAINKLRDYDETDAAVMGKVKGDAKTWLKRTTTGGLPNETRRNSYTKTDSSSKDKTKVEKVEDLRILNLANRDDDVESFESKTPNREYVSYLKHELRAIASALNISYEILMLIFTEGSFSSQRAALIHNRHIFRSWTQWVIEAAMDRICNWRIAKAMKRGQLPPAPTEAVTGPDGTAIGERSQWYHKAWSIPYFDWVDPKAQTIADKESYNLGTTSLKRLNAGRGQDRDDVLLEKADDIRAAREAAAQLGEDVTWRDLISTKAPGQR